MQWNLHLVGHDLENELHDTLQKFIADLESIGHELLSATLTTDAGPTSLATKPVDPEPEQTVGGEPVAPTTPPAPTPDPTDPPVAPAPADPTSLPVDPGVSTDTPPSL